MGDRMAKGKGVGIAILAVALAALLLFTACGPATRPTEKEKVVRIGWISALTGPAAGPNQYAHWVIEDYIKYANDENLVPGVTLVLDWEDGMLDLVRELSAYRKMVDRGDPIIIGIADAAAFRKIVEKDQTPLLNMAISPESIYPPSWTYSVYPLWEESFSVWAQWVVDNWKEGRPPRVGLIGPDEVSGPPSMERAKPYVEELGMEMLPSELIPWVPLDTTTQLLRLKDREADYIYICAIWTTAVPVLKDAERLGLLKDIQFSGAENTQSQGLLKAMGATVEGYAAPRIYPWWQETDYPGIKLLQDMRRRYGGRFDFQGDEANTLAFVVVAVEAAKRAVEKVGYENLDGPAVKEGLDSLRDFDVYGIKTISYTPEDHRGTDTAKIYMIQGGQPVPVSDWIVAPMLMPEE
ncbi:MAG: ABC transporter substrate-binding protein [Dehalococcoidia bacterium]|nr:MAG: ABC transporter substrate-binding protein [Dehalococcoidia bacterium]